MNWVLVHCARSVNLPARYLHAGIKLMYVQECASLSDLSIQGKRDGMGEIESSKDQSRDWKCSNA